MFKSGHNNKNYTEKSVLKPLKYACIVIQEVRTMTLLVE